MTSADCVLNSKVTVRRAGHHVKNNQLLLMSTISPACHTHCYAALCLCDCFSCALIWHMMSETCQLKGGRALKLWREYKWHKWTSCCINKIQTKCRKPWTSKVLKKQHSHVFLYKQTSLRNRGSRPLLVRENDALRSSSFYTERLCFLPRLSRCWWILLPRPRAWLSGPSAANTAHHNS